MSIVDSDLKFFEPAARGDFDGSGGFQTATELGTLAVPFDQLFQDTSDMDQLGRVDLEKIFVGVASDNVDPLLGAYVFLSSMPAVGSVSGVLMPGSASDIRANVKGQIESYQSASFTLPYHLVGTHLIGQTQVRFYLDKGIVPPVAGTVLLLSVEKTGYTPNKQYIRLYTILSIEEQEFIDINRNSFVRTVVTADIQYPLQHNFESFQPVESNTNTNATVIRSAQRTAGLNFYGIAALTTDLLMNASALEVSRIDSALIPANTIDIPLLDYAPFEKRQTAYEVEAGPELTLSLSAEANEVKNIYFPLPLQPAQNVVSIGNLRFEDIGDGTFACMTGDAGGYVVSADYADRKIFITRSSSWNQICIFDVTYSVIAEVPIYSQALAISDANRRTSYVFLLDPLPQPTSTWVEYFTGGKWYTLKDNGGGVVGAGTNEGSGQAKYETGSLSVTLGGLPDVNSAVLVSWCAQGHVQVSTTTPRVPHPLLPLLSFPHDPDPHPMSIDPEPQGNRAPTANAGQPQSAPVGNTVTLSGAASSDPDNQALTYRWHLSGRPWNSTAEPATPNAVSTDLTLDAEGTYYAVLTVSDGWKISTPATVTIIALPSLAPVADAGHWQAVSVGQTVFLDGSLTKNSGNYAWVLTSKPAGSNATLTGAGTATPTFVADKAGDYLLTLTNQNADGSSTATTQVTTNPRPPVVDAGADQSGGTVGVAVLLNGGVSNHPDGITTNWQWSVLYSPGTAPEIQTPTQLTASFVPTQAGNYLIELAGEEQDFFTTARDTLNIWVQAQPNPPSANAGQDKTGSIGATVTLTGSGTPGVGQIQTYRWTLTQVPAGSNANLNNATLATANFIPDRAGSYTAQLVVTDSVQASSPDYVAVTVPAPAPRIQLQGAGSALVGSQVLLDATGSVSYRADNVLSYQWSVVSAPVGVSLSGGNTPFATVTCSDNNSLAGSYTIRLTVTDSGALTSQSETVVTFTPKPVLVANLSFFNAAA